MSPNVGFAKLPIKYFINGNFANPKRKRDKRKRIDHAKGVCGT